MVILLAMYSEGNIGYDTILFLRPFSVVLQVHVFDMAVILIMWPSSFEQSHHNSMLIQHVI